MHSMWTTSCDMLIKERFQETGSYRARLASDVQVHNSLDNITGVFYYISACVASQYDLRTQLTLHT